MYYPPRWRLCSCALSSLSSRVPISQLLSVSKSLSQLFHGPTPRSPLHRLSIRLRRSRSTTSTEYSLPGATQLSQVRSVSPSEQGSGGSMSPCVPVRRSGFRLLPPCRSAYLTTALLSVVALSLVSAPGVLGRSGAAPGVTNIFD